MIEQQGQVVAVNPQQISVRLGGKSMCATCTAGKGCGAGIFGKLLKRRPTVLDMPSSLQPAVGQAVVVGLPEAVLIRLVSRLYLFPLLSGLVCAGLGHYLSNQYNVSLAVNDAVTLISALVGGCAALIWNRRRENEFPGEIAVHLLRVGDPEQPGACDRNTAVENNEMKSTR